jgi:hypothetical protein
MTYDQMNFWYDMCNPENKVFSQHTSFGKTNEIS